MTDTNDILRTLLSNFPAGELPAGEPQRLFDVIKTRISDAPDSGEELNNLYKVQGFSDFAMGLMWMVDRAKKNPGQIAIGPEDETLLLSSFRKAIAGHAPVQAESPAEPSTPTTGGLEQTELDVQAFAGQVEQLAEAVQSGSGGTRMLLEDLVVECDTIKGNGGSPDVMEFTTLFAEFLKYLSENELFDDVRVINILSNVSSTVSQWANTPADGRAGILEDALNLLRDFKSHFE
jgi:hypothetical protein